MGKNKTIKLLLLCISLAAFTGCSKKKAVFNKPDWVIAEDSMVNIITDIRIIESAVYEYPDAGRRDKKADYDSIYHKYNITDSLFRKSHSFYTSHPDVFENIYEQVIDRLSQMEAENAQQQQQQNNSDTAKSKPGVLPFIH